MQLSLHSDYSLRVLLYLGSHPEEIVTTRTISEAYGISKHHLVRVVQTLGESGFVSLLPGRNGGIRLAMDPHKIRIGDVVRRAEPNLTLLECFDPSTNTCPIIHACGLKGVLHTALRAFLAELDQHTLGSLMTAQRQKKLAAAFVQFTAPAT